MAFPQIGGSAFGFGFQGPEFLSGFLERDWAKSDAATAMQHSWRSAQDQMQFQERMSGTAYQRAVQDMQSAGLNPMLAYQQGGASAPQGAGFPGVLAHRTGFGTVGGSGSADLKFFTAAQVDKAQAEARSAEADARQKDTLTPLTAEKLRQEANHISEDIARIRQDVQTGSASAEAHRAATEVARAQLPKIAQEVRNLVELSKKYVQEVRVLGQEEKKLQQQVKANLPEVERLMKDWEAYYLALQKPGAVHTAVTNESWFGAFDRAVKSLTGRLGK